MVRVHGAPIAGNPVSSPTATELAAAGNVNLRLSTDRASGVPPRIKHMHIRPMADTDADGPACLGGRALPRVKLVFRASARRDDVLLRAIDGVKVCPHEDGRDTKCTCVTCAYCLFKTDKSALHAK